VSRRLALAAALAAIVLLGLPAAAAACNGGWTAAGMETQLMCPSCHQRLDLSSSPIADHIRRFVRRSCRAGLTSGQVKDRLVGQFGEEVLAAPPARGFDLLAWLVPAAVLGCGALVAALIARSWARGRAAPAAASLDADIDRRIDADMERLP
jgi:cytochrome c-type biogenesis protein CcmH